MTFNVLPPLSVSTNFVPFSPETVPLTSNVVSVAAFFSMKLAINVVPSKSPLTST